MEDFQCYFTLFLVWLVSIIIVQAIFKKTRTPIHLPPSPLALPIIGHLHLLDSQPHRVFHRLSSRYGPLIYLSLGSVPCVVASSAEVAKELLKTHESSFSNHIHYSVVDHLYYPTSDFVFAEYGPYWKFMKKLCMSQLLGGRTLDQHLPIRTEEIKRLLRSILKRAEARESVDVGGEFTKLSNNIISRMVMSQRCAENDDEAAEIRKAVNETTELSGKFDLSDYLWFCKNLDLQGLWKKGKEIHEKFDKMMERTIEERQEARDKSKRREAILVKDLLDILLEISDDESSEIRLTRENIKSFIMDMFVAGTDSTSITLEWALGELINHAEIMNKAMEEIDSVVGKTRLVEESDITNLPFIQAIVKETFRLHPTAAFIPRESSERCTINGYDIPPKTRLFINLWSIGRDPNYWEDPLEFKPARFLGEQGKGNSLMDVRGQNFHLMPFGTGRRVCPGASLALQVVQTSLAAMIQCFEWKVDGGTVDMEEGPTGTTLPRAHPLICFPVPRLPSPIVMKDEMP